MVVMYLVDLLIPVLGSVVLIVCVMVGVAFLTLLERKVLGYIQLRKGPNKLGFMGVLQPFSDAIKLFTKEQTYPMISNYLMYYLSPVISLFLVLLCWMCIPLWIKLYSFNLGIIFFFSCISLGVYTVMLAGWSSNSNYALLGGLRAVAQTISYEVSLILLVMSYIYLINSFNFYGLNLYQKNVWFIFLSLPLGLMLLTSLLAETNRTPFDFAEGESELVSGFNIEYSSGGFALIFLAEYASILFMSMFFVLLFLGADINLFFFYMKLGLLTYLFIWVRGTLPRFRYDKLMYLVWKSYLPLSLCFLMFFISLKMILLYN
ncbi:NADH dehydrogenase subunit 1 (mitochondrion) [Sergentomyia squamirostris]